MQIFTVQISYDSLYTCRREQMSRRLLQGRMVLGSFSGVSSGTLIAEVPAIARTT